ncbi:MAG: hypothetical protein FJ368_04445, partial [Pelagibacterales bacterium]|nr:hypothetical protein [Pelagibacterales bacterium]
KLGCDINISQISSGNNLDENHLLFGEDQGRYVVAMDPSLVVDFKKKAEKKGIFVFEIATVIKEKIKISNSEIEVKELVFLNQLLFQQKFS